MFRCRFFRLCCLQVAAAAARTLTPQEYRTERGIEISVFGEEDLMGVEAVVPAPLQVRVPLSLPLSPHEYIYVYTSPIYLALPSSTLFLIPRADLGAYGGFLRGCSDCFSEGRWLHGTDRSASAVLACSSARR